MRLGKTKEPAKKQMKTVFDIADLPNGGARLSAGLLLICP